jgi:hypothetical protein
MKMESPIMVIISVASTFTSGVLLFIVQRFFNNQKKKEEAKEQQKADENALILRSLNALGKLTVANAIALRDGRTNGEMSSALSEYEKIEKEMYEHLVIYHSKWMQ